MIGSTHDHTKVSNDLIIIIDHCERIVNEEKREEKRNFLAVHYMYVFALPLDNPLFLWYHITVNLGCYATVLEEMVRAKELSWRSLRRTQVCPSSRNGGERPCFFLGCDGFFTAWAVSRPDLPHMMAPARMRRMDKMRTDDRFRCSLFPVDARLRAPAFGARIGHRLEPEMAIRG